MHWIRFTPDSSHPHLPLPTCPRFSFESPHPPFPPIQLCVCVVRAGPAVCQAYQKSILNGTYLSHPLQGSGNHQRRGQKDWKSEMETMTLSKQCFLDVKTYRHGDSTYKAKPAESQQGRVGKVSNSTPG